VKSQSPNLIPANPFKAGCRVALFRAESPRQFFKTL
jgi:hypothetical protein